MVAEGDEKGQPEFLPSEIWNNFACCSTASAPMVKRIARADSARQIGPERTLRAVLIAVESGGRGG